MSPRQHHLDPLAEVPLTPQYFVLGEVYHIRPVPVILSDLLGIVEIENVHRQWFLEAAEALNPDNAPVPRIAFPDDLFGAAQVPQIEPIPGMKSVLQALTTNIVQEQRAELIYRYFSRETSGPVSDLFADINLAIDDVRRGKAIKAVLYLSGPPVRFSPFESSSGSP